MALDFMYARAGYGIGLDLSFPLHVRNAKEGGVPLRGAYWAMRPSRPVIRQVDLLDKAMDDAGGDLFPVLDVEILDGLTPREVADASLEFCERIESRRGLRCVVYSYIAFLKAIPFEASFTSRALFAARYSRDGKAPSPPKPWAYLAAHQYDGDGGEKAPNGLDLDYNRSTFTPEQLKAELFRRIEPQ